MPAIKPINNRKLAKVFEKFGWVYNRTKGDHLVFIKNGFVSPVVIPKYKNVPIFIIKNNLRTAKISAEEYFKALKKK
ncbi:hypothetical protein A2955_04530 [Candidatus Woesebacteria bacterium RIFCSPLOWO2_01_FULL_37_19]|uniref:Addiction module toxin, HicA family n=1 Tax=Candidatus Woesebacteria bacterium RIFCSPLOWO2_01_FULL_37_19 TaxID=1802514 RepID=A0A1F8B793_9BACT|nr:MAG: hypothetical protein A2955_04530 [Candidatus Woesebacteria bacterium RIFCSPLOWO2_01_FULL_37_19]